MRSQLIHTMGSAFSETAQVLLSPSRFYAQFTAAIGRRGGQWRPRHHCTYLMDQTVIVWMFPEANYLGFGAVKIRL
jgi:hypothetical protein